jgi:hypothetical protein
MGWLRAILDEVRRARLRSVWRRLSKRADRRRRRRLEALADVSSEARVRAVAARERMPVSELEDALQMLARRYPMTMLDVLGVVEAHGLADAQARIEEAVTGGG